MYRDYKYNSSFMGSKNSKVSSYIICKMFCRICKIFCKIKLSVKFVNDTLKTEFYYRRPLDFRSVL